MQLVPYLQSGPERALRLSPMMVKLGDLINTLRVVVGAPVYLSQAVQYVNGDNRIGLEENIDLLRDISSN